MWFPRTNVNKARLVVAILMVGVGLLLWPHRDTLQPIFTQADRARAWFLALGVWGPAAFVLLNALQVVVAPLPGYPIYAAAGYVFGPWAGGIYATLGMALGGWTAAVLGRLFGRPVVLRLAGEENVRRWEHVLHADSLWLWGALFLGPTGDVPFHLAGLSSLPLWKTVLLGVVIRGPATVLLALLGAHLHVRGLPGRS